jgi:hypothetical protein
MGELESMDKRAEEAVQKMDDLMSKLQTTGMSDALARQIEDWQRLYGALINPEEYEPLIRALNDHAEAMRQPGVALPAATPPVKAAPVVSDNRTVKLLEDIAHNIAGIAKAVSSAGGVDAERITQLVLDRLDTSARAG